MGEQPADITEIIHRIELTPSEQAEEFRRAEIFLLRDTIKDRVRKILGIIETTPVKSRFRLVIEKIGITPETPPDSHFTEIPADIPKRALFVSGKAYLPIPVCPKKEETVENPEFEWQILEISFSFYRKSFRDAPIVLVSFDTNSRTSSFLKPIGLRVAERGEALKILRKDVYERVPEETFYEFKDEFESIYIRWIRDEVQRIIDTGELEGIVKAIESRILNTSIGLSSSWFDLRIVSTNNDADQELIKTLRRPSGEACVSSFQSWVGHEAQQGWLKLCRLESYARDYVDREMDFLAQYGDEISDAIGEVDHVLILGIGNFIKEERLLGRLLLKQKKDKKSLTVHGVDINPEFQQFAFHGMDNLRKNSPSIELKYKGHISLFSKIPDITDYIRLRHSNGAPRIASVILGNTFGNFSKFEDMWSSFTEGMKTGDILVISGDVVSQSLPEEERNARIKHILARYESPEWREWVLHPLYRAFGQDYKKFISPNNVKIAWDDTIYGVVITYTFPERIDNQRGMSFNAGEVVELFRSKKIDPARFTAEAGRNGFRIKQSAMNPDNSFGCFILEKV